MDLVQRRHYDLSGMYRFSVTLLPSVLILSLQVDMRVLVLDGFLARDSLSFSPISLNSSLVVDPPSHCCLSSLDSSVEEDVSVCAGVDVTEPLDSPSRAAVWERVLNGRLYLSPRFVVFLSAPRLLLRSWFVINLFPFGVQFFTVIRCSSFAFDYLLTVSSVARLPWLVLSLRQTYPMIPRLLFSFFPLSVFHPTI